MGTKYPSRVQRFIPRYVIDKLTSSFLGWIAMLLTIKKADVVLKNKLQHSKYFDVAFFSFKKNLHRGGETWCFSLITLLVYA
jgi:hypothetical protein